MTAPYRTVALNRRMLAVHAKPSAHGPQSTQGGRGTPLTIETANEKMARKVLGCLFFAAAALRILLEMASKSDDPETFDLSGDHESRVTQSAPAGSLWCRCGAGSDDVTG